MSVLKVVTSSPAFRAPLRDGLHAPDVLTPQVLGVEQRHHVVVMGVAALPRCGHTASQRIQAAADVVVTLLPGLPFRPILGVGLFQGETPVVDSQVVSQFRFDS